MWGYVIVLTIVVYAWYKNSNEDAAHNDSTPPTENTDNAQSVVINVQSASPPSAVTTPVFSLRSARATSPCATTRRRSSDAPPDDGGSEACSEGIGTAPGAGGWYYAE